MATQNESPEARGATVSGWLDILAVQHSSPLYDKVISDCQQNTNMLGRTATNAITKYMTESPSTFLPMAQIEDDVPYYTKLGQRFGATHVCLFENGNLPSDDALVKTIGESATTFNHYIFTKSQGELYLPHNANTLHKGDGRDRWRGLYSVLFIGKNALESLK